MPIELLDKITKIHIVPYSHHDHAWCNTREWHIQRYIGFFIEVLEDMRRNPDLTIMVDNAVHSLVPFAQYCPEWIDEFRQRVAEGRIELMNGGYGLARPNYVGEETFIRNLLAGDAYFRDAMHAGEIDAYLNTDTSAGHSQLPQVLRLSGLKYASFYRPEHAFEKGRIPREFVWEGLDGSEVTVYRAMPLGFYQPGGWMFLDYEKDWESVRKAFYEEQLADRLSDLHTAEVDEVLVGSGVDDALLFANLTDKRLPMRAFMQAWNSREPSTIEFSTYKRFFSSIAQKRLPVVAGTLEQTDVSFNPPVRSNRSLWRNRLLLDRLLLRAERLGTMLAAAGGDYPAAEIDRLWMRTLDICGHAMEWLLAKDFEGVLRGAEAARTDAERLVHDLSDQLAGRAGQLGDVQGVVINPLPFERKEIVELHLTSKEGVNGFKLFDAECAELPYQIVEPYPSARTEVCENNEITVAAEVKVPPMGFTSALYRTDGTKVSGRIRMDIPDVRVFNCKDKMTIDNGMLQITFEDGMIESIRACDDTMYWRIGSTSFGTPWFFHTSPMSSWMHSWDVTGLDVFRPEATRLVEAGPLRWRYRAEGRIGNSHMMVDTVMRKDDPVISFEVGFDNNNEEGFYSAAFPAQEPGLVLAGIPFGAEERDVRSVYGPDAGFETSADKVMDCPGQFYARNFVSYDMGGRRVAILPEDCSIYYRHVPRDERMELMLMKSIDWDKRTDPWVTMMPRSFAGEGQQSFRYAFYIGSPGEGPAAIMRQAQRLQQPLQAHLRHHIGSGSLAATHSFIKIEAGSLLLSSLHRAGDFTVVRMYEGAGKACEGKLKITGGFQKVYAGDFKGHEIPGIVTSADPYAGVIELKVSPWQIVTVYIL